MRGGLVGCTGCAGNAPTPTDAGCVIDRAGAFGAATPAASETWGVLIEGRRLDVVVADAAIDTGGAEAAVVRVGGAGTVSRRVVGLRESLVDAERDGPSRDATSSDLSTDFDELSTEGPGAGTSGRAGMGGGSELLKDVLNMPVCGGSARVSSGGTPAVFARYSPNSYLSAQRECVVAAARGWGLTSNELLELAVPLRVFKVRRRRVPDFVGVVDGICSDIADLFHVLYGRKGMEAMSTECNTPGEGWDANFDLFASPRV